MMERVTEDLVAWLRAQLARDEQLLARVDDRTSNVVEMAAGRGALAYVERWPIEVHAKRRILDEAERYSPELEHGDNGEWAFAAVLRLLALPYAHRPGYRDEWKP